MLRLAAALALACLACVGTVANARMCQSTARYPSGLSLEVAQVGIFHPDKLTPGAGDSMCLLTHQDKSGAGTS